MGVLYDCRRENASVLMKRFFIALVGVGVGFCCHGQSPAESTPIVISQPNIFWHNGEWQTYKNGVWTPYHRTVSSQTGAQARGFGDGVVVGNEDEGSRLGESQGSRMTPARRHIERTRRAASQIANADGAGAASVSPQLATAQGNQPNIGIGQNTIGIGQRNGIGQTTIGIGQPNTGVGPRNDFTQPAPPSINPGSSVHQPRRSPRE